MARWFDRVVMCLKFCWTKLPHQETAKGQTQQLWSRDSTKTPWVLFKYSFFSAEFNNCMGDERRSSTRNGSSEAGSTRIQRGKLTISTIRGFPLVKVAILSYQAMNHDLQCLFFMLCHKRRALYSRGRCVAFLATFPPDSEVAS